MPTEFIPFIAIAIVLLVALVICIYKYVFLKNATASFILEDFTNTYAESILKLCRTAAKTLLEDSEVTYPSVDDYIQATTEKVIDLIRNYADENDVDIGLIKSFFNNKQLATIINNIIYFKSNEIIGLYTASIGDDENDETSYNENDYIADGPVDPYAKNKIFAVNDKVNIMDSVESYYRNDNEV